MPGVFPIRAVLCLVGCMTVSPGTTPPTPGTPTPDSLQAVPSVPWCALSPPRTPASGSCSLPACCRVVLGPAGAPSARCSSLRDTPCGHRLQGQGPCPGSRLGRRRGPVLTLAHAWRLSSHASVHDSVFDRQIDLSPCHGDMLGWLIGSCAIDTWLYENRTKHP